jgi:hypothetical protein
VNPRRGDGGGGAGVVAVVCDKIDRIDRIDRNSEQAIDVYGNDDGDDINDGRVQYKI